MNRSVTVAALQSVISPDPKENLENYIDLVAQAAQKGAQIILPPELFQSHYFCCDEREEHFARAEEAESSEWIEKFRQVARDYKVVLPISFFEKSGQEYFNSLAMIDADGRVLGVYRKSHIPDGPGYEEKYYFKPGNTGFKVWQTAYARVGVGICWDQWFPEAARAMTLEGAELLFYPTAIGSEPEEKDLHTRKPWQRVMQGHAVANAIPVVAANRIGRERLQSFYGHSFICDHQGEMLQSFHDFEEGILTQNFDLEKIEKYRASFGFFRDRRPELYASLAQR